MDKVRVEFALRPSKEDTGTAMATTSGARRHLASSPFQPEPEPTIETFEVTDLVSHDSHGMGRVTNVEAHAVTVDFGTHKLRIASPYYKLSKL
jgi:hypothetical protein